MRSIFIVMLLLLNLNVGALDHPQARLLKDTHRYLGDELFVPLFWLPETKHIVRKYIPEGYVWVGLEMGVWKEIGEDTKLRLLEEVGALMDGMNQAESQAFWQRVQDWGPISVQLKNLEGFAGSIESFLDMAYADPTLRPAFQWILDKRPPDSETKYIGATFSSGELASFYPHLVQHLVNTPEKARLESLARILTQIAASKEPKPDQGDPAKPATLPEAE